MRDLGSELRRLRESAGYSLGAFAAVVHFSKGYLSKVETGRARATPALAEACDQALGAGGTLLALVAHNRGTRRVGGFAGLPGVTPHLCGRTAELGELITKLLATDSPQTVVVSGMAGVGKTTLAVAAANATAHAFPDGCLFFDFRGHSPDVPELNAEEGLHRLLSLLGVPADDLPGDFDSLTNLLRDRLVGKRMLLVFDNVRIARQLGGLVPAEPRCRVVVTSRYRLTSLDDATHLHLGVLSTKQSIALFGSLISNGVPAGAGPATGIAKLCGGLPLAIRIIAARFNSGGWTLDRLRNRLAEENTRLWIMDDGERSVAGAFLLSYRHLPAEQRDLAAVLALHPAADTSVTFIAALAGLDLTQTEHLLALLHDANLLELRPEGYVHLHDLVRVFLVRYALPDLHHNIRRAAVGRLIDHAITASAAADAVMEPDRYRPSRESSDKWTLRFGDWALRFGDRTEALAWFHTQWPTLAAVCELAARHGRADACWHLALLLRGFFSMGRLLKPWLDTHLCALGAARNANDASGMAITLNNLGMVYLEMGELELAAKSHREAATIHARVGDERGATDALSSHAWVQLYRGDARSALAGLADAHDAYRRMGRRRNAVIALRGLALAATELGDFADARKHATEALSLSGIARDRILAINCLGWVSFRAQRYDEARLHYAEALALGREEGEQAESARALFGLGNTAAAVGDHVRARYWWAMADQQPVQLNAAVLGEIRVRRELEGAVC